MPRRTIAAMSGTNGLDDPSNRDSDRTSGAGTFVLITALIVVAWIAALLLPQGRFERVEVDGKMRVVMDSYAPVAEAERVSLGVATVPAAVPAGLDRAKGVIFFILIVGGAFRVLRETGATEAAIGDVLIRFGHRRNSLIMAGLIVFALGSSTIGMAEEYLPFVPILIVFGLGLGLDRVSAVGIVLIGKAIGYGTAAINPFTLLVAQGIAELPPTSGMWFRLLIVAPFLLLGFDHLRRHANRLARERGASTLVAEPSILDRAAAAPAAPPPITGRRLAVLACLMLTIGAIVYGVMRHAWYLDEMMALFLVAAVVFGIAGALRPTRIAALFGRGAAELAPTALLIGFAYAILVVLEHGQVVDTVIHAIAAPLERFDGSVAAIGMLVVQSFCNLLIPSGSGQAGVTMPIMAAVADLTGVTRQTAVLAFQFGDGLTNMIIPTNAILLGMLSMAGVTYVQWLRFIWPLMVKMLLLAAVVLVVAVWIDYA